MSFRILSIEDDPHVARLLAQRLTAAPERFEIHSVPTLEEGLHALATEACDCVLVDYRLPDGDGLTALRATRSVRPDLPVVLVTGAGSERVAVEAMKLGADDYVVKHGHFLDAVVTAVREAIGRHAILRAVPASDGAPTAEAPTIDGLIGASAAFRDVLVAIDRAAACTAPVVLAGESGTGKELVARAIHDRGPRAGKPFVAVNCAALPEPLLESELFGHTRGAFTGAERDRRGLFEEAHGGTLFLDEVSEMSIFVQAKLLRALQDGMVRPLGSSRPRTVDARIVAAANRDLGSQVERGLFRVDLYHRLHVLPIRIPPLRERRSDIPMLARHFLIELTRRERKPSVGISTEALALLARYDWPGNVRQLQNEIHRLVVTLRAGESATPSDLAPEIRRSPTAEAAPGRPLKAIVREVETATIAERLRSFGYHRTATARSLGLTREGLWNKLRQLGLAVPYPRDDS